MSIKRLLVWLLLALPVLPRAAAGAAVSAPPDAGLYTIVEGDVRVMRGTTWFKVAPGARALEADIIELGERATIQVELPRGAVLNLIGPAVAYAVAAGGAAHGKAGARTDEWAVERGWLKAAAAGGATPLRVDLPQASVELAEGTILSAGGNDAMRLFIESGAARITLAVPKGKPAPPRDAKAGEFWVRTGDGAPKVEPRVPPAFVATMPKPLLDPLPRLAARYKGPPPTPKAGDDVSYAEAEPWLAGPYRKAFVRRFTPRLSDAAFRSGVESRMSAYPEWDRVLHPAKYATDNAPATAPR